MSLPDCPITCTCGQPTSCPRKADIDTIPVEHGLVITAEEQEAVVVLAEWVIEAGELSFLPRSVRDAVRALKRLRAKPGEVGR